MGGGHIFPHNQKLWALCGGSNVVPVLLNGQSKFLQVKLGSTIKNVAVYIKAHWAFAIVFGFVAINVSPLTENAIGAGTDSSSNMGLDSSDDKIVQPSKIRKLRYGALQLYFFFFLCLLFSCG